MHGLWISRFVNAIQQREPREVEGHTLHSVLFDSTLFPTLPRHRPAETIVFQVSIDESIRMVNLVTHDARL